MVETSRRQHFLWGAATSSYQVEGGITNNDWYYFARLPGIRRRISKSKLVQHKAANKFFLRPAQDAARAWCRKYYVKDFHNARLLGLNAFRISLEWSRIEPQKGQWDEKAIDRYREMIKCMLEYQLIPIVTLNHFTLPLWISTPPAEYVAKKTSCNLLGVPSANFALAIPSSADAYWSSLRGWENYSTVLAFENFVKRMVIELKDLVDYWLTINEPVVSLISNGYVSGSWPPGFYLDGDRAKAALHNLIEAHIRAYDNITLHDDIDADNDGIPKKAGFSHGIVTTIAAKSSIDSVSLANIKAAHRFSYFMNDYFINAVVNGEEDLNYLDCLEIHNKNSKSFLKHENWQNKVDFIGLNYFSRIRVWHNELLAHSSAKFVGGSSMNNISKECEESVGILSDLGWEIYPIGLYNSLMKIKYEWNKPVLITENGIADKCDRYRAQYIIAHLQQVKRAIDDGANVIGYLHWSFIDNYEWLEGYRSEAKFGLFYIDYDSDDLDRHITNGACSLQFIINRSYIENENGSISNTALMEATDKFGSFTPDGTQMMNQERAKN